MKKKKNSFIGLFGSIIKALFTLIFGLIKIVVKALVFFGLWVPLIYALIGVILYYYCNFDPFDFSLYSTIYISGAIACVVCVVIITARNAFIQPIRNAFNHNQKQKEEEEPLPQEELSPKEKRRAERLARKQTKKEKLSPSEPVIEEKVAPVIEERKSFSPRIEHVSFTRSEPSPILKENDWILKKYNSSMLNIPKKAPKVEVPQIYFSELKPDILVHEYSDRFELYKTEGDKLISIGTEYK